MSHISKINVKISDLNCLDKAAKRFKGQLVRDVDTFKWFSRSRPGECNHRLEFENAQYDIGIKEKTKNDYELLCDTYSSGGLTQLLGQDLNKLKQAYSLEVTKQAAMLDGFMVQEKQMSNGNIQLMVSVN